MNKDKTKQGAFSTCLEGSPCAEMMQKIMGENGVGSLCEEMMRSLNKTSRDENAKPSEAADEKGPQAGGLK